MLLRLAGLGEYRLRAGQDSRTLLQCVQSIRRCSQPLKILKFHSKLTNCGFVHFAVTTADSGVQSAKYSPYL